MAKKTVVTVIDDIDGSEGADTIEFGLDGLGYVIDLSETNANALRQVLSPYVDRGRKVGGRGRGNAAYGAQRSTGGGTSKAARRWATATGIDVPASGRVPETILAQWRAAGAPA